MIQQIPERQSQEQDNLVKDTNIGRDLTFAPVQNIIETQIIQSSLEVVTQRKLNKNSPYQGLKRFNFKDRDRFFGRDKLITRLFEAVNRSSLSLVLGASGSGKSSVVRAGLIPELKKSLESQTFYDFIFTPNQDPFDSLYRCLLSEEKDYSFSKAEAEIALEAKADTLTELISALKKEEQRWLIFVDQFEELFTICDDPDKRKNFISGLVQVAKSGNSSVKIVLAMRSDFLDQFSFYPDLGVIANQNNIHLVTEMYPEQLGQAIEQPAARHGVVFEEGLVKQIIEEVKGQKGYLPLLQYTLDLLWESECQILGADGRPNIEDRTLNKKSYAVLEGVRGALEKRINQIYQNLNQDEQIVTKQVFVRLVNIVDTNLGSKAVSRRAYRNEFTDKLVENILNKFINENILVSNYDYIGDEKLLLNNSQKQAATVEIAHEILLTSWDSFKRWIEDEKEAIILKNWLAGETRRWQKIRSEDELKANDELLKGSRLTQAVEFRKKDAFKNIGGLRPEEEQFIDASVTETERIEKQKEEQKQRELEQERKARKAAHKTTIITLIAAPMLTGLLIVAGINWRAKQIQEIRNLSESSKALLVSNQTFDTLLESLQAAKKLKQSIFPPSELPQQVGETMQQALIKVVKENKPIDGRTEDITSVELNPDSKMIATTSQDGIVKLWSMGGEELQTLPHKLPYNEVVASVIFSPDNGKTIATVITDATKGSSKMVKLWSMDGKELQTLPYDGRPKNVIFSPDGQMIATISKKYTVTLWRIDGVKIKIIPNEDFVNTVTFTPDSKIIAIGGSESTKLWNTESKELQTFHHGSTFALSFSPNGQMIATSGFEETALWSIDGKELRTFPHDKSIYKLDLSPDSQKIVTIDENGVARLWSINDKKSKTLAHDKAVTIVRFSHDGQTIATVGKDKIVKLWSYDGQLLRTLTGHQSKINSISFSPDDQKILTSSDDKTVKLWSRDGQELQTLQHFYSVSDAGFSPDNQTMFSVSKDYTVKFWSFGSLKFKTLQGYKEPVNFVSFSPDGQKIATASWDTTVQLWSRDGQKLKTLRGFQHWTYDISFSPDGKMIATGGHEGAVRLWSIDGKLLKTLRPANYHAVESVSFSPDSQTIAIGTFDGPVEIWSRKGEKLKTLTGHIGRVNKISFSPDGQTIATASEDRTVMLWSIDGKELKTLNGHNDGVKTVRFSPDGQTITSVSRDGAIKLWNRNGEELKTVQYNNVFESVSFSPDAKIIATTSGNNTVQLWSRDGEILETLKGHNDSVMSVSFSPDGKTLATASQDNSVILWNLDFDKWESLLNKDLDKLTVDACNQVSNYLKKKSKKDSFRYLCDGLAKPGTGATAIGSIGSEKSFRACLSTWN